MTENVAGIFCILLNQFFVHHFTFNSLILVQQAWSVAPNLADQSDDDTQQLSGPIYKKNLRTNLG